MTRLFDLTFGQTQEFLKGLAHAGLSKEQVLELTNDRSKLGEWVRLVPTIDSTPQPSNDTPIADFIGKTDVSNVLLNHGIRTVGELAERSLEELERMRNFGSKKVGLISAKLAEAGIQFSTHKSSDANRVLDRWGVLSYRRDRLANERIWRLIPVPDLTEWWEWERAGRNKLTFAEVQQLDDNELQKYFNDPQIRFIREWIRKNVW